MNEDLLLNLMKAHRIGIEDAKTALKLVLKEVPLPPEQVASILERLDRTVILPTRVYKEIIAAEVVR